jgi:hypothetical protein
MLLQLIYLVSIILQYPRILITLVFILTSETANAFLHPLHTDLEDSPTPKYYHVSNKVIVKYDEQDTISIVVLANRCPWFRTKGNRRGQVWHCIWIRYSCRCIDGCSNTRCTFDGTLIRSIQVKLNTIKEEVTLISL